MEIAYNVGDVEVSESLTAVRDPRMGFTLKIFHDNNDIVQKIMKRKK